MAKPKHFDMPDDYNPLAGPSPADDLVERYYVPEMVDPPQEGWVRRASDEPKPHVCKPPVTDPDDWVFPTPAGSLGDLWRCQCGELWRIGYRCDACDATNGGPHGGNRETVGNTWRPATLWQRLRYRKAMR